METAKSKSGDSNLRLRGSNTLIIRPIELDLAKDAMDRFSEKLGSTLRILDQNPTDSAPSTDDVNAHYRDAKNGTAYTGNSK